MEEIKNKEENKKVNTYFLNGYFLINENSTLNEVEKEGKVYYFLNNAFLFSKKEFCNFSLFQSEFKYLEKVLNSLKEKNKKIIILKSYEEKDEKGSIKRLNVIYSI